MEVWRWLGGRRGAATYVSPRRTNGSGSQCETRRLILPSGFPSLATIGRGSLLGGASQWICSELRREQTNIGGARGWSSGSGIHQRVIGFLGVAGWPRADRVCNLPPRHSHRQAEHLTPTLFQSTSLFKSFCGFVELMCAE